MSRFSPSPAEANDLRRQILNLLNTPEGRGIGRVFVRERNNQDGDMSGAINYILEVMASEIRRLYSSPSPVMTPRQFETP